MHAALVLILLGSFSYVATMLDEPFAFAAQLSSTPRERFTIITRAHGIGIGVLVILAGVVSSALTVLPQQWVAIVALVPWALAWRQWHDRPGVVIDTPRRGALTTFVVTVGRGGVSLAGWIALFRAGGVVHAVALVGVLVAWQVLFVTLTRALVARPRAIERGQRVARRITPGLYVILGIVIVFECRLL